jgi:hypothetical protein
VPASVEKPVDQLIFGERVLLWGDLE